MVVDLRHSEERILDRMAAELNGELDHIAPSIRREPVAELWVHPPIAFPSDLIDLVGQAADELGMTSEPMLSGAGHDAGYVASRPSAATIFVPCRDGLSHQPQEWSSPEACAGACAAVLLQAVLTRAKPSFAPA